MTSGRLRPASGVSWFRYDSALQKERMKARSHDDAALMETRITGSPISASEGTSPPCGDGSWPRRAENRPSAGDRPQPNLECGQVQARMRRLSWSSADYDVELT
jgi:hypothetical protein